MNEPKISVIIPVYNVEKYLERCIASVLRQTYYNLEIILVDDGSTDNSGALCDQAALSEQRIRVIHKNNGGLSSARNTGLDVATGVYVAFVDSDDWIANQIYEKCISIFNEYNCDVVDFCVQLAKTGDFFVKNNCNNFKAKINAVEGDEILFDYLYRGQTESAPFVVWRKLYKRELFDLIRFPEGKVNEDIVTNYKILQKCKRVVHISDIGYFYFQGNINSITSGKLKKRDFDLLDASKELCIMSASCVDKRVIDLATVKLARSYFSLLAKAAVGGIDNSVNKKDIVTLTNLLRANISTLLKSPMPLNRKILALICCVDYRCISIPYKFVQKIRS